MLHLLEQALSVLAIDSIEIQFPWFSNFPWDSCFSVFLSIVLECILDIQSEQKELAQLFSDHISSFYFTASSYSVRFSFFKANCIVLSTPEDNLPNHITIVISHQFSFIYHSNCPSWQAETHIHIHCIFPHQFYYFLIIYMSPLHLLHLYTNILLYEENKFGNIWYT